MEIQLFGLVSPFVNFSSLVHHLVGSKGYSSSEISLSSVVVASLQESSVLFLFCSVQFLSSYSMNFAAKVFLFLVRFLSSFIYLWQDRGMSCQDQLLVIGPSLFSTQFEDYSP